MGENQNEPGPDLPMAEEPQRFPWDDPKWEGHTHSWPDLPDDDDAAVTCDECGLPMQVGLIRADQDGGPGD
jgi:hypothetical protein